MMPFPTAKFQLQESFEWILHEQNENNLPAASGADDNRNTPVRTLEAHRLITRPDAEESVNKMIMAAGISTRDTRSVFT